MKEVNPETAAEHVKTLLLMKDGDVMPHAIAKYYKDRIEKANPDDITDASMANFKMLYEAKLRGKSLDLSYITKETELKIKAQENQALGEFNQKAAEATALGYAFQAQTIQQNNYLNKFSDMITKAHNDANNNPLIKFAVEQLLGMLKEKGLQYIALLMENKELRAELRDARKEEKKTHIQGLNMLTENKLRQIEVIELSQKLEAAIALLPDSDSEEGSGEDATEKMMEEGALGAITSLFDGAMKIKGMGEALGLDVDTVKSFFKKKKIQENEPADKQENTEASKEES